MVEKKRLYCNVCGNNEFDDFGDGIMVCTKCGAKIQTAPTRRLNCDDYHERIGR